MPFFYPLLIDDISANICCSFCFGGYSCFISDWTRTVAPITTSVAVALSASRFSKSPSVCVIAFVTGAKHGTKCRVTAAKA